MVEQEIVRQQVHHKEMMVVEVEIHLVTLRVVAVVQEQLVQILQHLVLVEMVEMV
jgi:hypothetical protein